MVKKKKVKKKVVNCRSRLTEGNWLYHVYHLAGNMDNIKDCKVCVWYGRIKERTKLELKSGKGAKCQVNKTS